MKYKRTKTPKREQLKWCAAKFADILDRIDNRCMAADGPVTPTLAEASTFELQALYRLATKIRDLA